MIRVQFNNSASMMDADFKLISDSAVQLSGKKVKPNTRRFSGTTADATAARIVLDLHSTTLF